VTERREGSFSFKEVEAVNRDSHFAEIGNVVLYIENETFKPFAESETVVSWAAGRSVGGNDVILTKG